ncbi:unnamed protein product, partial [Brugia pahangi]|uniref:Uncharacterized protein n=1 Tax=Brugia pahangi TaxID=6280 RepID=A0A0N4TFR0_BRUPA
MTISTLSVSQPVRPRPKEIENWKRAVSLSANSVPESPSTYAPPLSAAAHHQPTTPYSSKLARQSGTL